MARVAYVFESPFDWFDNDDPDARARGWPSKLGPVERIWTQTLTSVAPDLLTRTCIRRWFPLAGELQIFAHTPDAWQRLREHKDALYIALRAALPRLRHLYVASVENGL